MMTALTAMVGDVYHPTGVSEYSGQARHACVQLTIRHKSDN